MYQSKSYVIEINRRDIVYALGEFLILETMAQSPGTEPGLTAR